MEKHSGLSKPRIQLRKSIDRQLDHYSLAAMAAGVGRIDKAGLGCGIALATAGLGLLALPMPAQAKIVYTPLHKVIHPSSSFGLDLNNDGVNDLFLDDFRYQNAERTSIFLAEASVSSNKAQVMGAIYFAASDLDAGARIGGEKLFRGRNLAVSECSEGVCGFDYPWANKGRGVKDRYLGLKFYIDGKPHYGWARLDVSFKPQLHATLTGYAYETVPRKPIIAGKTKGPDVVTVQPITLGHLARGASVPVMRRKEN